MYVFEMGKWVEKIRGVENIHRNTKERTYKNKKLQKRDRFTACLFFPCDGTFRETFCHTIHVHFY